jgi:serine protease Do
VGAPFRLAGSVTSGIVSAKGRNLNLGIYDDFLQTDAAINPGNSGGPLVNLEGKVIGITTAIKSSSGGFQGVGMAIPSNLVKEITTQLARDGTVRRGYIGIQMQDLTPDLAEQLGVNADKGVVVGEVFEGTPAEKAGLKQGDVITTINGQPVATGLTLQRAVTLAPLGKPMEFAIVRDGRPQKIKVTIEEQPANYGERELIGRRRPRIDAESVVSLDQLGIGVTDLNADLAERQGLKDTKGVVIMEVEQGSLAHFSGLRPGMVIAQADKQPVETAAELKEALSKASLEKGLLLLVKTPQGGSRYIVVRASDQ